MRYIDANKLIAEIERRIESWAICGKNSPAGQGKDTCESRVTELSDLLSFIASLQQEQPQLPGIEDPGIPGKDFIPVEWVDACEMYGKRKIVKQEQPEVDLEKEIKNYLATKCAGDDEPSVSEIARHFYELGLNARKEE